MKKVLITSTLALVLMGGHVSAGGIDILKNEVAAAPPGPVKLLTGLGALVLFPFAAVVDAAAGN